MNFLDPVRFLKGRCHDNQFCVARKHKPYAIFAIFTPYESALDVNDRSEIFFNISRNVAMATTFVAKLWQNYLPPTLCRSETEWDIATSASALTT